METAFSKRDWAYAGLSHPKGVVLARPARKDALAPGNKVVLVGDESAANVGQFLGKLALDSKVNFRFEWERGQLLERWATPERMEKLLSFCPSLLLFMLPTKLTDVKAIEEKLLVIRQGAKQVAVRWVLPMVESDAARALACALAGANIKAMESEPLLFHRAETGALSARGSAGWAGAIWRWVR